MNFLTIFHFYSLFLSSFEVLDFRPEGRELEDGDDAGESQRGRLHFSGARGLARPGQQDQIDETALQGVQVILLRVLTDDQKSGKIVL